MLESSSAVQAINIAGEFQRHVPLTSRRDWADSLLLVPGVVATIQPGSNKVFYYLHGADFSSLVLQIDGADMASTLQNASCYINLSDEAIQDTQVKTGAVDAATPIGAGAIVSVVTRSGTNQLTGAARLVYQGDSWNGTMRREEPATGSRSSSPMHRWEAHSSRIKRGSSARTATRTIPSRSAARPRSSRTCARWCRDSSRSTMDTEASYFFVKGTAQLDGCASARGLLAARSQPRNFRRPELGREIPPPRLRRHRHRSAGGIRLEQLADDARRPCHSTTKASARACLDDDVPSRNVHQSVFPSSGRLFGTGTLVVLDNLPGAADQPADKLTLAADATWYRDSAVGIA